MNTAILTSLLILSPIAVPSGARPPSAVDPSSNTWAVVHAGELWICWTPRSDCFERIVFDDSPRTGELGLESDELDALDEIDDTRARLDGGSDDWRIGFAGSGGVWVERGEQRWRVLTGQRHAQSVDEPAPVRLQRIRPASCGPAAMVPAVIGGQLGWREAPRCPAEATAPVCATPLGSRLRSPTPIRLRASLELARTRSWATREPGQLRTQAGLELGFVLELGFDVPAQQAAVRARALVLGRARAQPGELPPIEPGPLAAAERDALTQIVCQRGWP